MAIHRSSVVQKNGIKLETKSGGAVIKGITCGNIKFVLDLDGDQVTLVFDESKAKKFPQGKTFELYSISNQEDSLIKEVGKTLSIYGMVFAERRDVTNDELKARKERKIVWN